MRRRCARCSRSKADVERAEADGTTALHWAVQRDDDATGRRCCWRRARRRRLRNRYGVTPLYLAADERQRGDGRRGCSTAGADPNAALPDGETVLMTAARTGNAAAIEALVADGADVNAREAGEGQTALMWAAAENNAAAIRVLVEAGADIATPVDSRARSRRCCSPCAAATSTPTRALLDAGADVNERAARRHERAGARGDTTRTTSWPRRCSSAAPTRTPTAQGWTALHQIAWSRRHNAGFNLPGPVPTGPRQPRSGAAARGARRRRRTRADEGAARRQPQHARIASARRRS